MRIAVSTDDGNVAAHFGRCAQYTIVDVEDGKVIKDDLIQNPGHRPGFLPQFLSEMGVNCIITGGMGMRAQALFAQHNIDAVIGVTGSVSGAIKDYLKGELVIGESQCDHGSASHKKCGEEEH